MFALSGKAKDVKKAQDWLALVTKGMTIIEALAVITTNPFMIRKLKSFPGVTVSINSSVLRSKCV